MSTPIKFAFFGGEPLGVPALKKLHEAGLVPSLVVCNPDRPSGRGQQLTPPPTKVWAEATGVPVFQPDSYKDAEMRDQLTSEPWDLFVVVAYNFILPEWLLNVPSGGTLNLHPSLLPQLRGASPIRTAILKDLKDAVGVTVMLMDREMDHGPIIAQEPTVIPDGAWPINGPALDALLAEQGGSLLAKTIPAWMNSTITPQPQDHSQATYCNRFAKEEHQVDFDPQHPPTGKVAREIWHKINAFAGIGETFFIQGKQRVKINRAHLADDTLHIDRVTPAGKKEIAFADYLRQLE